MELTSSKPWHVLCLSQSPSTINLETLAKSIQALGREFQDSAIVESAEIVAQSHAWYLSQEGQETSQAICVDLWTRMQTLAKHAMPAHDARHAMYKVPASALQYLDAENVSGFERLGVLGALMHDYGRWAEERLYGCPGPSVLHARLSFLLCKEVLEAFEMPEFVRQQLLLAPLNHSSGAVESDPMIQKLTVSGDRDQLYGPELVLRLSHHSVADSWVQASFYGEKAGTPILERLKHFHDNRLPGPLFSRQAHVQELQRLMRQFILLAEPFAQSSSRWVGRSASKFTAALTEEQHLTEWTAAQEDADATSMSISLEEAMANLLSAKNIAPGVAHYQVAMSKISDVPHTHKAPLMRALDWVTAAREAKDKEERAALLKIREKYSDDALIQTLSSFILTDGYST